MPVWKFVISEPDTKKSYQLEVDQANAIGLVGKRIGEEFSGDLIGLQGYALQITGGTDKDGFPMHPKLRGSGRRRMLLISPPCFHPTLKGQRKRKTVRGNTISDAITQINIKVVKKGLKPLEEIVPKKEPVKQEEKPKEVKKEEKPKQEAKKAEPAKEEKKTIPEKA